ncbi:MAG: oxygen-independent coproporphyrinogen III oxidase [Myxococcales bacterium]|nr:oxygen-independent coproporphyrinogen III oxidase [Myxococcales bacterium]
MVAPRYTSYPPATAFGPVNDRLALAELTRLGKVGAPLSLYVHVPFCRSLCWYCGCNVTVTRARDRGDSYVDTLATEMVRVAQALDAPTPVTEISLGGGSPNFLKPGAMSALASALERYFTIAPDARRSIELDPRATTPEQIDALAAAGWNTVSIGVQDFDAQVQEMIGRHQSVAETRALVERVRAAGVDDLNMDLIYGLPRQTEESLLTSIDAVVELGPDRIALFGYAHVPEMRPHQRLLERKGRLPDRYERAALVLAASARLRAAGYVALGLDHFAKPTSRLAQAAATGRMTRNFQGYAERLADAVIGLGASAISSTPRAHWQNHAEVGPWSEALAKGELPVHRGLALTHDDCIRGDAISTLMCTGELDLEAFGKRWDIDAEGYFADALTALADDADLATVDRAAHRVVATPLGQVLIRNVCARFDRYHQPGTRRGSVTV